MDKTRGILLLSALFFGVQGCVCTPVKTPNAAIESAELAADINFLAQPALKGRKPGTIESQIAREFITDRFRQCGLTPWPDTDSFEQSFGLGTNVIGVLPGSDSNLANQIVVLSAHYDHLGKKRLGACDNASGLAAMLEIAESLALSSERPRRSIAFAAFDCEEQFAMGAFAFTCSQQFSRAEITAIVNADMLGRDFLGVVPKSLFVIGTESYPAIREHIIAEANRTDLKILPIGTTLVGPTGDHIPFETFGMPVLFFSCGFFTDYHKPGDTAEKLNYQDVKTSAEIILDTVRYLADAEKIEKTPASEPVQKYELETLDYILKTATANQDRTKSSKEQAQLFQKMSRRISRLLEKDKLTQKDYLGLLGDILAPTLALNGLAGGFDPNMLTCLGDIYISHREFLIEKVRCLVCSALKDKPTLFSSIKLKNEEYNLPDDFISFTGAGDGQYVLYVLLPKLGFDFDAGGLPIPHSKFDFSYSFEDSSHCTGSMDEVTDYCLLKYRENLNNYSWCQSWQKVITYVTGMGLDYDQQLNEGGFGNERQWVSALTKSSNNTLAAEANHIELLMAVENGQYNKLLPLVDKLNDENSSYKPNDPNRCEKFDEAMGPFADHPCFFGFCQDSNSIPGNFKGRTNADYTLQKLRALTHQKFGKNKAAWKKWIKAQALKQADLQDRQTAFLR